MVAHLKLLIAQLKHDRFGASSERGHKLLDQLELQFEELEAAAAEDKAALDLGGRSRRPAQGCAASRCAGRCRRICRASAWSLLGEDVTETLEVIPRRWKVIQTVRERLACRACEAITQPPAPFHPIARGRAGPELLAMILEAKFGQHLPLNRQSETYAREGVEIDVSTMADWVGACTATLAPLTALIEAHVMAAGRIHGDDTTVPELARGKTATGRLWADVRDDGLFGGLALPGAVFFYSRDRRGEHPHKHLAGYAGILQADAYAGFNDLDHSGRKPAETRSVCGWADDRGRLLGAWASQAV